jgi:hypothetical protein
MLISREWVSNAVPIESWLHGVVGYADGGATCKAKCHAVRIEYGGDSRTANVDLAFRRAPHRKDGALTLTLSDAPPALRKDLYDAALLMDEAPPGIVLGRSGKYPGMGLTGTIPEISAGKTGPVMLRIQPVALAAVEAFLEAQAAECRPPLGAHEDLDRSG